MTGLIRPPFFEIGPKNLLRRAQSESLARAAGRAGSDFGVAVILTVPTAFVAPISELAAGVHVFAQGLDPQPLGDTMNRVTAEALVDAGAAGVMLNHDSDPLDESQLVTAVGRAHSVGLATIVCAATVEDAVRFAALGPTVVLLEPPALIGTAGTERRDWIPASTSAIRAAGSLAMHAGGVSSPAVAEQIMAEGADGTGSTSGVIAAPQPGEAARAFIAATRAGWDRAAASTDSSPTGSNKGERQ
ncbi:MAG: tpiA 1 [Microbacteriaceae bacterium]|nr:tpiA 1 [Microbacteriaceae bacterium]